MPEPSKSGRADSATASGLSLAARLYSVFALIAVLTAAITVLSDYNTRRNAELTEAVETASRAALNVQRVNSLVYAVVMESRGVYMSADTATAKKFGDGLLKFNAQILDVVKSWQSIVRADDAEQFAAFKKRIEQFVEFRKELVRRGVEISPAAGREWGDNDANRAVRTALNVDLEHALQALRRAQQAARAAGRTVSLAGLCADRPRRACAGRGRHRRPDHFPLGRAAAFRHHRHHQAGRGRCRECRGAACRPGRRDRRAGARDPYLPGGDGAQPQSQFAGPAGFRGARGADPAHRNVGRGVPRGDRRRAARGRRQRIGDARYRAVDRQSGVGRQRTRRRRGQRHGAGVQQRERGRRRGRGIVGLRRRRSAGRFVNPLASSNRPV